MEEILLIVVGFICLGWCIISIGVGLAEKDYNPDED